MTDGVGDPCWPPDVISLASPFAVPSPLFTSLCAHFREAGQVSPLEVAASSLVLVNKVPDAFPVPYFSLGSSACLEALLGRGHRLLPSFPAVCFLAAAVDTRPAEGSLCHGPGDRGLGPGCPPAEEATAEEEAGRARDGRRTPGDRAPSHPHGQEGPVGEER